MNELIEQKTEEKEDREILNELVESADKGIINIKETYEELEKMIMKELNKMDDISNSFQDDYQMLKNESSESNSLIDYGTGDSVKKMGKNTKPFLHQYGRNVLEASRSKLDIIKLLSTIKKEKIDATHKNLNVILKFIKDREGEGGSSNDSEFIIKLLATLEGKIIPGEVKNTYQLNSENEIEINEVNLDNLMEKRIQEIEDEENNTHSDNEDNRENKLKRKGLNEKWVYIDESCIERYVAVQNPYDEIELLILNEKSDEFIEIDEAELKKRKLEIYWWDELPFIKPYNYEIEFIIE